MVEGFWDVNFSCNTVEGRVVDSYMNGCFSNLFTVLVYYLEVGDVGSGWLLAMLCLQIVLVT